MSLELSSPGYDHVSPARSMDPKVVLNMWSMVNSAIAEMKEASEDLSKNALYREAAKINMDDLIVQRELFWQDRSEVLLANGIIKPE